jgi:signal transduction histidine kinase
MSSGIGYVATETAVEFESPDGEPERHFLNLLLQPMSHDDGGVDGLFLHAVDVSEQVRARLAMQEGQKQKDELMVVISHDLKSPLAIIMGHALLLLRRLERGQALDLDMSRESLRAIQTASRNMTLLIGNLVEAARSSDGTIVIHRAPTDLVDITERLVREFRQSDDEHSLRFERSTDSIVGQWDSIRLESIVANLITNALKFSPTDTEVLVSLTTDGDDAVLVVEDHGIGIPESEIRQTFNRFWRASNAAGHASGSGIGLFGVQQMVRNHGGTISVESQEGVGSRFTVRLPLSVEEGEPAASG